MLRVLFLCTGNSARSIFAEFLLRHHGAHRFQAFSAGSAPRSGPHPLTLRVLRDDFRIDPSDARSKSWDEFRGQTFDLVITVCDQAKATCPLWPGATVVAHWNSPDPSDATGTDEQKLKVFREVALQIQRRVQLLCNLPFESLDRAQRSALSHDIGATE
jgi:arsenate reductase (thioredoxin)